jgi:DinB superfamily
VRFLIFALLAAPAAPAAFGADAVGQIYDQQVGSIEREVLALVQAMPAGKFDFAPTNGAFAGVRTFALQARHDATIIWRVSASVLGEPNPPVDTGPGDNGPDTLKTKDQIVDYFKNAVAYAHKAMSSLTQQNMLDQVPSPFGPGKTTRLASAAFLGLHSYDHYGQMVVYARMNGVVPPASAGPGPAPGSKGAPKAKQ